MKPLALILLATTLISCRSTILHYEGEQCSPFFVYADESQKIIDVDKSFCSCRLYEMNIDHVGSIVGTGNKKPLPYCHKLVGFKNYDELVTFAEEVRIEIVENQSERTQRFNGTTDKQSGTGKD
jgi:predicted nucleic acid-binding Zn finger protein